MRVYEPTDETTRAALACTIRVTKTSSVCNSHPWFATGIFSLAFSSGLTFGTTFEKTEYKFPTILDGGISVEALRKMFRFSGDTKVPIVVLPALSKAAADFIGNIAIDIVNAKTEKKKEHAENLRKNYHRAEIIS